MRQYGQASAHSDEGAGVVALVFRAGPLLCALSLDEVVETMRPIETRALAGTPAFVRGITVLRGVPTPVIDVSRLLGGGTTTEQPERYLAVRTERGAVALATGEIVGIRTVEAEPTGPRQRRRRPGSPVPGLPRQPVAEQLQLGGRHRRPGVDRRHVPTFACLLD